MTRLAAENPHAAQLAQLGEALTNPEQQWAVARTAVYAALRVSGVPEPLAETLADEAVLALQKAAAPHVEAPGFALHGVKRG